MSEDNYMSDPRAKSAEGFVAALAIFAKHWDKGMAQEFFMGAEHDVIYIYDSDIPEDSENGIALNALGFHWDGDLDGWAYFT